MTIGERIEARRKALGIKSQSELARRAGIRQSTLNGLINRPYRWSPHLVHIARELQTSVEYLTGETDDPDANAPPPPAPPSTLYLTLPVAFPVDALEQMFEGLLLAMDRAAPVAEQARLLVQRLPNALLQISDLLPAGVDPKHARRAAPRPTRVREHQ